MKLLVAIMKAENLKIMLEPNQPARIGKKNKSWALNHPHINISLHLCVCQYPRLCVFLISFNFSPFGS